MSASEADDILLLGLREVGCPLDGSVKTLKQLLESDPGLIYQGALAYAKAIEPQREPLQQLPEVLPRHMSARVNACTTMATSIKEMGYRGELSYHQLLYPNENDVRHVLMWLSKVHSETKSEDNVAVQRPTQEMFLSQLIGKELLAISKQSWMPMYCTTRACKPQLSHEFHATMLHAPSKGRALRTVPGLETYFTKYMSFAVAQPPEVRDVPASVLETNLAALSEARERDNEWNQSGLNSGLNPLQYRAKKKKTIGSQVAQSMQSALAAAADNAAASADRTADTMKKLLEAYEQSLKSGSQFKRQVKYGQKESEANAETPEERLAKQNKEFEEQKAKLTSIEEEIDTLNTAMQDFVTKKHQIEVDIHEADQKREPLEREYRLKKRTFDLLPEADANIAQLQQLADKASERLLDLATEWEKHRVPLVTELRKLMDMQHEAQGESRTKLDDIKKMRAEMKRLIDEIRQKDERYKQLLELFKSMPGDMSRSSYTRRILEIVKNVKKQKVDMNKVLEETRQLQKEINSVSETLDRSFAVAEEMIYQDAKKENKESKGATMRKQAYKHLVAINENFKKYVKTIEEMGATANSILNLEAKIEQVQSRTSSLNMERVEADLKQIRTDNARLMSRIKEVQEGRADPGDEPEVVSAPL